MQHFDPKALVAAIGIGFGPRSVRAFFLPDSKFRFKAFQVVERPVEVSVHEPPRQHSDRSTGGPFEQEFIYTFEETGGGETRLTHVAETEPGGFFKLVGPLLERTGIRQFRADLQSLKDLLEAHAET